MQLIYSSGVSKKVLKSQTGSTKTYCNNEDWQQAEQQATSLMLDKCSNVKRMKSGKFKITKKNKKKANQNVKKSVKFYKAT